MPKIPNLLAFGKHYHNCGKWMQRRALRKDVVCNLCNGKIFARNCKQMQLCSRCVECDNIILDNFNYCECCGLETNRQLRITKARALSNLFPKNQAAPDSSVKSLAASTIQPDKSLDLFDDFQVDNEELTLLEESLVTDDVSSDIENNLTQLQESLLTDVSLEEEKKENILNGWQTTEEASIHGQWQPQISQSAADKVIARMYNYSFSDRERYYLRLLLLHVKKPTCFRDGRTYENSIYKLFREAAQARGAPS